jgi:hypothetical protein
MLGLAALGLGAIQTTASAQAIVPVFVNATASGSNFVYTYNIDLQNLARIGNGGTGLSNGNLTIFDFNGLVGTPVYTVSTTGATFNVTTPALGTGLPNGGIGQGDTSTPNINLNYTGSLINNNGTTDIVLGVLTATSTGAPAGLFTGYSGNAQQSTTTNASAAQSFVQGPNFSVPEPGSVAMLVGMGVSGAGFLVRRRRNRK